MAIITLSQCPVCKSVAKKGIISCYCEYYKTDTPKKVNTRVAITRPTRKVRGLFTITGFSDLGYGVSAKINLEKDGEKFQLRLWPLQDLIIGKSEIELTLFEQRSGGWSTSGYNDDYIYDPQTGKLRLKEDFEGRLYITNMKYHNSMLPGRYPRIVLQTPDGVRQFEVFAKTIDWKNVLSGAIQVKLREDCTGGSYVWKIIKWQ